MLVLLGQNAFSIVWCLWIQMEIGVDARNQTIGEDIVPTEKIIFVTIKYCVPSV